MQPILLGIPGLEYQGFMECEASFLLSLMNSVERGVTENRKPQYPDRSWWSILMMEPIKDIPSIDPIQAPLVKLTRASLINIPIADPTYGKYSIRMNQEVDPITEINNVISTIITEAQSRPVIASINALDRFLHTKPQLKCEIYNQLDRALRTLIMKGDITHIILFSPYGNPQGPEEGNHSDYGIYIATITRPRHEDTVKVHEIGYLFNQAVEDVMTNQGS
ncbi:hypothetical protein [Vulcanisaeta souniana]|uniref:Uncharacterized protein n=1 Tax=Vulcanisaeta souniana JCM 11219 TaxID=1293586 RepID=A0A830ECD8_9CREN|nr:hypothetical protein [Vulcanisaeta souniana]BDR92898.1 hypothetical protein Vsou_19910 [Vulcanisaeta souniana JCM 11219]GGI85474.1 hypothetical protein GCM10007112_23140 [Vulcanisaeta souniana JCM 11219]